MFIRQKEVKGGTYYQMVEGYRENGRVRHRTIISLGWSPTVAEAISAAKRDIKRAERRLEKLRSWWPNLPMMSDWPGYARIEGERLQRQLTQRKARIGQLKEVAKRYGLPTMPTKPKRKENALG